MQPDDQKNERAHLEETCQHFEDAISTLWRAQCNAEMGTAECADQFSEDMYFSFCLEFSFSFVRKMFMQLLEKIEEKSHFLNDMEIPAKLLE